LLVYLLENAHEHKAISHLYLYLLSGVEGFAVCEIWPSTQSRVEVFFKLSIVNKKRNKLLTKKAKVMKNENNPQGKSEADFNQSGNVGPFQQVNNEIPELDEHYQKFGVSNVSQGGTGEGKASPMPETKKKGRYFA